MLLQVTRKRGKKVKAEIISPLPATETIKDEPKGNQNESVPESAEAGAVSLASDALENARQQEESMPRQVSISAELRPVTANVSPDETRTSPDLDHIQRDEKASNYVSNAPQHSSIAMKEALSEEQGVLSVCQDPNAHGLNDQNLEDEQEEDLDQNEAENQDRETSFQTPLEQAGNRELSVPKERLVSYATPAHTDVPSSSAPLTRSR